MHRIAFIKSQFCVSILNRSSGQLFNPLYPVIDGIPVHMEFFRCMEQAVIIPQIAFQCLQEICVIFFVILQNGIQSVFYKVCGRLVSGKGKKQTVEFGILVEKQTCFIIQKFHKLYTLRSFLITVMKGFHTIGYGADPHAEHPAGVIFFSIFRDTFCGLP